jgi:hypothetical protein
MYHPRNLPATRTHSDENTEHETRDFGSIVESIERVSNESEKRSGTECRDVGKQEESKVKPSIQFEPSHEIDDDGEDQDLDQKDR